MILVVFFRLHWFFFCSFLLLSSLFYQYINFSSSVTEMWAKTEEKKLLPFFYSGGHTKLTSKLFLWCLHCTGTYTLFFCICVSIYYDNPRVESKRYVVNKNTSFGSSGIGVLWPPVSKKKIPKPKILYD